MPAPDKAPKRRPGRPRSEGPSPEYLARKEEIVTTAIEVFRVRGDAAGTLQEVADVLGLQRASLYHYVHSKAHLLSLICERVMNVVIQAMEAVAGVEDPTERLVAAIRVHVTTIAEHQNVFKIFFEERASLSSEDKARMRDLEARYVSSFAATVATAIDADVLPRTDPRQAALALIGLGSWLYKWFNPERDDPLAYVEVCLALLGTRHRTGIRTVARSRPDSKRASQMMALGIDCLGTSLGTHLCAFYRGPRELEAMLIPFLREGLRSGDKTICVIDSRPPEKVLACLRAEIDVAQPLANHQLEVLPSTEAHLSGGYFDRHEMIAFWDECVGNAVGVGGFPRVRTVGEMSWALRDAPGTEDLFPYEAEVNRFSPRYPQVLLCLYDLERVDGSMVINAMRTHPKLLIDRSLVESPCYTEPEQFLASWN